MKNKIRQTWHYISNIGITSEVPIDEARSIKLLNRVCFISLGVCFITLILELVTLTFDGAPIIIFSAFLILVCLWLTKRRYFLVSRIYFMLVAILLLTVQSVLYGKIGYAQIFFIANGILPLMLFKSKRSIIALFLLNLICFFLVLYWQENNQPYIYLAESLHTTGYVFALGVTMVALFFATYYFKMINADYEQKILDIKQEVEEKNKDITDSIRYSQRIQNAILPPPKLVKSLLKESFVLYKPKDIVAGDFYWIEAESDKVFFSAADCTGHGVPGAMLSVMCSTALSKSVKELEIHEPARILDKVVEILEERFAKSEEDIWDGMDLALCCLDLKANKIEFAGANNQLYLIRNGKLNETKGNRQPVGRHDNRKPFTNHAINIETGDCIYLSSDGYPDQFGGPKDKKFTYRRFRELLVSIHQKNMDEQKEILDNTIEEWKGATEQIDDICVIGVRM